MPVNRPIIAATAIIMATGAYVVLRQPGAHRATLTRVIVGGYVLAVIVSIVDLAGGPASKIASGLVLLALLTAILAVLPDLLSRFKSQPAAAAAATSGAGAHPTIH